jgi:hypothetical protein
MLHVECPVPEMAMPSLFFQPIMAVHYGEVLRMESLEVLCCAGL